MQRGSFFPLSQLFFPPKRGHRGSRDTVLQDAFTVGFGRPTFEQAFAKICRRERRLAGAARRRDGRRVRGVPW